MMVLGAHSMSASGFPKRFTVAFSWLFDGSLGVRFFFVISGFLITWLMLVEQEENGKVSRRDFYIRRALRILPVYYAFLTVILLLQSFTRYHLSTRSWIGNLTFTANYLASDWTTSHLWSLAQEEQFYLLWPTLFILSGAHRRMSTVAVILAVPILICPMTRILCYLKVVAPILTSGRGVISCDSIAIGCACAIIFTRKRDSIREFVSAHGALVGVVGATLIVVPYVLSRLFFLGMFTVPFGETSQAIGFAILLLHSVSEPARFFYRALNWRWVCEIGVLSYSIYIWQQIFCSNPSKFGLGKVWWMTFPVWIASALLVASLSFYCLERPFLRLRARFRTI
jgi:peptidoglycan/LPS O-acetylase OafA/YrhL